MLETPLDISIATIPGDQNSGTRIAVFNKRQKMFAAKIKQPGWPNNAPSAEEKTKIEDHIQALVAMQFLRPYLGPSVVFEITTEDIILPSAFLPLVEQLKTTTEHPRRLLIKSNWKPPSPVPRLTLKTMQYLYTVGFELIGVDWPYIDDSEKVKTLMDVNNMVWIVNLDLSEIEPFRAYFFSALPLRTDIDGEVPCRAYLVPYEAANV